LADVRELFEKQKLEDSKPAQTEVETNGDATKTSQTLPAPFTEIEVKVLEISSTGDGLAVAPGSDQIYVVPFTAPGDVAKVKVIKHFENDHYSLADYISIIEPSSLRDDSRINCKYFSKCSGCQFQMLDYATQLEHKKSIVDKAYKNFSQLPSALVPEISDTMGSPLQYGYRTKLTPHFDGPPGHRNRADARAGIKKAFETVPEIGFMQKNRRVTLDIEDCPIGTPAVRMGMKLERQRVADELSKYSRGATLLLRESTQRIPNSEFPSPIPENTIVVPVDGKESTDLKTCITDNNATSKEYIDTPEDTFTFTNPAGAFFQNNNSILNPFTQYIRDNILPPASASEKPVQYLIDAYSGSGLFTITLSSLFTSSIGIDISAASIASASENAALNSIPASKASFLAADAPELFKSVQFPPNETVVVIDPPRKGCDDSFLRQLLNFGPRRVIYVSCNVHTQARDVGILAHGYKNGKDERGGKGRRYKIESLRGFDFFPQTGHVEGVAVLSRVEEDLTVAPDAEPMDGVEKLGEDVADADGIIATGALNGTQPTTAA
jgi:tRNA (uracil-5-)-methyltransferase